MSRVYEISYLPEDGFRWPVRVDGSPVDCFPSRFEALRAAVNLAVTEGGTSSIRVEGADGVWRPFGNDVKRPVNVSPLGGGRRLSVVR